MNNNKPTEKDLLALLDIIIISMMLIEQLEDFQLSHYNKMAIKMKAKNLLSELTKQVEKDYALVFRAGESDTLNVQVEYMKYIQLIRDFNVPQKVALSQFAQAWNYEKDTIEATVHRIIAKYEKLERLKSKSI